MPSSYPLQVTSAELSFTGLLPLPYVVSIRTGAVGIGNFHRTMQAGLQSQYQVTEIV